MTGNLNSWTAWWFIDGLSVRTLVSIMNHVYYVVAISLEGQFLSLEFAVLIPRAREKDELRFAIPPMKEMKRSRLYKKPETTGSSRSTTVTAGSLSSLVCVFCFCYGRGGSCRLFLEILSMKKRRVLFDVLRHRIGLIVLDKTSSYIPRTNRNMNLERGLI